MPKNNKASLNEFSKFSFSPPFKKRAEIYFVQFKFNEGALELVNGRLNIYHAYFIESLYVFCFAHFTNNMLTSLIRDNTNERFSLFVFVRIPLSLHFLRLQTSSTVPICTRNIFKNHTPINCSSNVANAFVIFAYFPLFSRRDLRFFACFFFVCKNACEFCLLFFSLMTDNL
jgi:hypothetical protein